MRETGPARKFYSMVTFTVRDAPGRRGMPGLKTMHAWLQRPKCWLVGIRDSERLAIDIPDDLFHMWCCFDLQRNLIGRHRLLKIAPDAAIMFGRRDGERDLLRRRRFQRLRNKLPARRGG